MANNSVIKHRSSAFDRQGARCYYCGFQMWRDSPEVFAQLHGISLRHARHFQCTAEHLVARQDGGTDTWGNIVAACLRCNRLRHQRKKALGPEQYRALVQQRLSKGRWHSQPLGTQLSF